MAKDQQISDDPDCLEDHLASEVAEKILSRTVERQPRPSSDMQLERGSTSLMHTAIRARSRKGTMESNLIINCLHINRS